MPSRCPACAPSHSPSRKGRLAPPSEALRALALTVALLVGACNGARPEVGGEDTELALRAALVGERLVVMEAGTPVPLFDRGALPMVQVEGQVGEDWTIAVGPSARAAVVVPTERLPRGRTTLFRVRAPFDAVPGAAEVVLLDAPGGVEGAPLRRWTVRFALPPEELAGVAPIVDLRKTGRLRDALTVLAWILPHLDPTARLWALVERARCLQLTGDPVAAVQAWHVAAEAAEAAGSPTEASRRWRAAAFQCLATRRFAEANAYLDRAEEADAVVANPVGRVRQDYYRALVADELGDYRRAAERLESARTAAFELGLDDDWLMATEMLAVVRQDVGQHAAALALVDEARRQLGGGMPTSETWVRFTLNRSWILLRGAAEGALPYEAGDLAALLEDVRGLAHDAGLPVYERSATLNLAWLAFRSGAFADARRRLDEMRALGADAAALDRLFVALLEAELALAEGALEVAEAAFVAVGDAARVEVDGGGSEIGWRALHGLGRVRLARGERAAALADFRTALAIQEDVGRRTALRGGRAAFFADRRGLADDAVELLLAEGQPAAAFEVASAMQGQVLRAVEARVRVTRLAPERLAAWQERASRYLLLRDAFEEAGAAAPPMTGAALAEWEARRAVERARVTQAFEDAYALLDAEVPEALAQHPRVAAIQAALAPDEALVLFAAVRGATHAYWVRHDALRHEVVGNAPLAAWTGELGTVRHLYVVPGGYAGAWAIGAMGLDVAGPLGHATISYLPDPGFVLAPTTAAVGAPVVVADPAGDLPFARREGREVASRLPGARLLLGEDATRARVLEALPGAALVHVAAHGILRAEDPWEAHLQLAGGEALSLADVLVAHAPTGVVVLSGCRTGALVSLSRHETVGLAAGFLLAGARAVLATSRDVPDEDARRFIARFYAEGGAERPAEAMRAAARGAHAEGNEAWDAFHVMGRP